MAFFMTGIVCGQAGVSCVIVFTLTGSVRAGMGPGETWDCTDQVSPVFSHALAVTQVNLCVITYQHLVPDI